jgi:hypothetical protein
VSGGETVYVIDQVTPRPGMAQRFLAAYLERYAPGARARGMTLEHSWVAPPVWLDDGANTLTFVWSVRGAAGWWAMAATARQDPAVADWWWNEAAAMVASRQRSFASSPADVGSLADV